MNYIPWALPLVQNNTPPVPDENAPVAQLFLGLGLSATMLVGFLFLFAFLVIGWLAISWTRKDHRTPPSAHLVARRFRSQPVRDIS